MNSKKNSILLITINFIFVIVAILLLINFFPKDLFQKKVDTFNPLLERIEIKIPAKGFIAKQEILFKAPIAGKVKRIKQAPELLAKNDEAVQIIPIDSNKAVSVKTNVEGFITYIKDNCEEKLSWDQLAKKVLTETDVLSLSIKQEKVSDDQVVEKGDFIFKIVKDNIIHYYLIIDTSEIKKFSDYGPLVFTIDKPRNIASDGKVVKTLPLNEKKSLLIFETSFSIQPLLNDRQIEGAFTFPYVTACYLPSKAVKLKKDPKGVDKYYIYLKKSEGKKIIPVLTEITVLGQDAYSKNYIVDHLKEDMDIFKDFSQTEKKFPSSGK